MLGTGLDRLDGSGEPAAEVALLNNLAAVLGRTGRADEAAGLLQRPIRRNEEVGDRHREAALRRNLADQLRAGGDDTGAAEQVKLSAALFAEVGGEPGSLDPEIWKLREW